MGLKYAAARRKGESKDKKAGTCWSNIHQLGVGGKQRILRLEAAGKRGGKKENISSLS